METGVESRRHDMRMGLGSPSLPLPLSASRSACPQLRASRQAQPGCRAEVDADADPSEMGERYHRPSHWLPHVGLLMWGVSDELSDIAERPCLNEVEVSLSISRDDAPKVKVQGTRVRKRGMGKAVSACKIDVYLATHSVSFDMYIYPSHHHTFSPPFFLLPSSLFPLHHQPPPTLHSTAHPSPSPRPDPA
jgi:hypothetical protein